MCRGRASAAALARRATFNLSSAGERNLYGDGDLVSDVVNGVVELDAIETEQLPAALQPMSPAERETAIREDSERRDELKRQIGSLYFERSGLSRDKTKLAALAQEGAETAEPRLTRLLEPAPEAITSGITPRMNDKAVIKIGRKRSLAASRAASMID